MEKTSEGHHRNLAVFLDVPIHVLDAVAYKPTDLHIWDDDAPARALAFERCRRNSKYLRDIRLGQERRHAENPCFQEGLHDLGRGTVGFLHAAAMGPLVPKFVVCE